MATTTSLCGAVQGSKTVLQCFPPGKESLWVPTLISLFANIAGVSVDCPTLNALAQQYACIPPQNQLPALLYLAVQIVNNSAATCGVCPPGPPGPGVEVNPPVPYTVGNPPAPLFPTLPALAYDPTGNLPTMGWNTSTQSWN